MTGTDESEASGAGELFAYGGDRLDTSLQTEATLLQRIFGSVAQCGQSEFFERSNDDQ